jgi:hypothetical protein
MAGWATLQGLARLGIVRGWEPHVGATACPRRGPQPALRPIRPRPAAPGMRMAVVTGDHITVPDNAKSARATARNRGPPANHWGASNGRLKRGSLRIRKF